MKRNYREPGVDYKWVQDWINVGFTSGSWSRYLLVKRLRRRGWGLFRIRSYIVGKGILK